MWKVTLAIWGSTAIAIVIALYYTHDIRCLWFLLIPACMRIRSNDEEREEENTNKCLNKLQTKGEE